MEQENVKSLHIRKPKLLRVAEELSKFKDPPRAKSTLFFLLESSAQNCADTK